MPLNDKNFTNLKEVFKRETGMDASTNMEIYISYFQAKMADNQMQIMGLILQELMNRK